MEGPEPRMGGPEPRVGGPEPRVGGRGMRAHPRPRNIIFVPMPIIAISLLVNMGRITASQRRKHLATC